MMTRSKTRWFYTISLLLLFFCSCLLAADETVVETLENAGKEPLGEVPETTTLEVEAEVEIVEKNTLAMLELE